MNRFFVGSYSHPDMFSPDKGPAGRGEGLYQCAFDDLTGTITLERVYRDVLNPTFLAFSADGSRLYCAHELETFRAEPGGGVSGFSIEANGGLRPLNAQSSRGAGACHVSVSPDGTMAAAANYSGGSVALFPVAADGMLGKAQVDIHTAHGPNPHRQRQAHVHAALFTPDSRHLLVADLGGDTVTAYDVSGHSLSPALSHILTAEPGDGPRMFDYDAARRLLYTVCELTCRIAVFACDECGVPTRLLDSISTLPVPAEPGSTAADVRLSADGRFLYASTRGQDSLTVYSAAPDGSLALIQNVLSGGKTPRGFTLSPSGRWLLCGNQDSDTIISFAIDSEKGTLAQHASFPLPSPVCLVFVP